MVIKLLLTFTVSISPGWLGLSEGQKHKESQVSVVFLFTIFSYSELKALLLEAVLIDEIEGEI